MKPVTLTAIARHRHGLVPLDIAVDAGVSRSAWYRLLASGRLEPVHPGVARLPGAPATHEQRILAAVLACGPGAAASHRSAAYLWGAGAHDEDPVDVILPPERKGPSLAGVVVHRPRDAAVVQTVRRRQIPCVDVLRTVVDHAAVVDADRLALSLDRLVVSRLLVVGTLRTALAQHRKRGRLGVRALDEVLRSWSMGDKPPDGVLEPAMATLLLRHGLPPMLFHHVATTADRRFELDFARLPERVDVEVDGWEAHGTRAAFLADRRRDALLTAAGWVVQRFTWFQVMNEAAWVARRIGECLAGRSPHLELASGN
jgi:hypothetical protein